MKTTGRCALAAAAAFALVSGIKMVLAGKVLQAADRTCQQSATIPVTVLQPILSGDRLLGEMLSRNAADNPQAAFVWLVDADDPEGQRVALSAAAGHENVQVRVLPPVRQGANPKVAKLAAALRGEGQVAAGPKAGTATTEVIAVLDDDTVLPAGALTRLSELLLSPAQQHSGSLAPGLVTGLPVYETGTGPWSRLVAAWVNGNAAITYLPLTIFGPPVSINGMCYLTTRTALTKAGGFEAIENLLCDDFELAQAYRRAGLPIVQAPVPVRLATTVTDAVSYARIMRRWMVFARRLLTTRTTPASLALVVLPAGLPAGAMLLAICSASPAVIGGVFGLLSAKAAAMAALRSRWLGTAENPATVFTEVLADLAQPGHVLAAQINPGRIVWRGRSIDTHDGTVRYPDEEGEPQGQ